MAVTSGFFNSLYGDRKYNAEQFSALFNGLINDGVFANIGTAFGVQAATGNGITVGIGRAWFNGIWVDNDAILPMTCNDPEVLLDRIDALVIEINRTEAVRAGRIIFVRGTASGSPSRPVMTHDDGVDQYPLAYIRRKAGVSDVVQADITNAIGTSECPYVTGILDTVNIDNLVAQWESEFDIWFDGLQVELSGDVAANLASQVIELNARFNELAETRTVTAELEDSSYDTIEDSNGNPILGSTVFGDYGGGSNEVVISPVESDGFEVGDILLTTRTDLDEKWFLCNGQKITRLIYPKLSDMLPINLERDWSYGNTSQSGYHVKTNLVYFNNEYIFAGLSGSNELRIYYSDSPNTGFKTLSTGITLNSILGVVCSDDTLAIAGYYTNDNKYYIRIVYSSDIHDGAISYKDIFVRGTSGNGGCSLINFVYCGNYFIICGRENDWTGSSTVTNYGFIYYGTNPASLTRRNVDSQSGGFNTTGSPYVFDVVYHYGKYYVCGCSRATTSVADKFCIGSASSPGSLTFQDEYSYFSGTSTCLETHMSIVNDEIYAVIKGSDNRIRLVKISESATVSNSVILPSEALESYSSLGTYWQLSNLFYIDGQYLILVKPDTDDPSDKPLNLIYCPYSSPTSSTNWSVLTTDAKNIRNPYVYYYEDKLLCIGVTTSNIIYNFKDNTKANLPLLSPDHSYAYIKALE